MAFDPADRLWKLTADLPAGQYEFKAAINGSWDENYGQDGAPNGSQHRAEPRRRPGHLPVRPQHARDHRRLGQPVLLPVGSTGLLTGRAGRHARMASSTAASRELNLSFPSPRLSISTGRRRSWPAEPASSGTGLTWFRAGSAPGARRPRPRAPRRAGPTGSARAAGAAPRSVPRSGTGAAGREAGPRCRSRPIIFSSVASCSRRSSSATAPAAPACAERHVFAGEVARRRRQVMGVDAGEACRRYRSGGSGASPSCSNQRMEVPRIPRSAR